MSRIPTPERGQPLDLSYIYAMAEAINDLSEEGSALSQGNNFILKDKSGVSTSSKLYGAQVTGMYVTVAASSFNSSSNESTQTVNFTPVFASPPIVTATIVNTGGTTSGTDVSVVLKNITTSSVDVVVKFATSELSSVGVNLIAIGLP
jgi:hypothetical protein